MSSMRKKRALKRFTDLVKSGSFGKSKFLDEPGGLSGLSTESLQAAKGRAPLPKTNMAIKTELENRSVRQQYDNAGHSPRKASSSVKYR